MKVGKLFDLTSDAQDLLAFFEGVESPEQLISRLERLKRANTEDLMLCVQSMRTSLVALLDDVLEMNASLDDEVSGGVEDELDAELEKLADELEGTEAPSQEDQSTPRSDPPAEQNSDASPSE